MARHAAASAGGTACIFGGTFDQLSLHEAAHATSLDTGRIAFCFEKVNKVGDLPSVLGTVIVNSSLWLDVGSKVKLVRCNKDAEVAAVALVAYWVQDERDAIFEVMSDIVFDARAFGTSLDFKMRKFSLVQEEDDARDVLGMSAVRKCLMLAELSTALWADGRFSAKGSEPERMEALMKAAGQSGWSTETCRRYLSIGRRLSDDQPALQLLQKWELFYKRSTLVDSITNLRAVVGAATSSEDRR